MSARFADLEQQLAADLYQEDALADELVTIQYADGRVANAVPCMRDENAQVIGDYGQAVGSFLMLSFPVALVPSMKKGDRVQLSDKLVTVDRVVDKDSLELKAAVL